MVASLTFYFGELRVNKDKPQRPGRIPRIGGAKFEEPWDIENLQAEIDKLLKREEKLRVLFLSEASFLQTGFSTYCRHVLARLAKTDKYELAEFGCIPDPYAKIQMANGGQKPISMIKIGDEVLTHTGQIQKVTQTFKKHVDKTLVKISRKIFGGDTLEVTDNHPVLVIKKENAYKKSRDRCFNQNSIYEWVRADEVRVGDFVAYANESFDSEAIDFIESEGIRVPLTHQTALLFGWFLADGCIIKDKKWGAHGVSFCCNIKERKIMEQLCLAFESVFNIKPNIQERPQNGVLEVKITNRPIARFFYTLFGLSAYDKFISQKLWNAPMDWVIRFLAAYFEGDGCINENRNVLCAKTVSRQLSDDIMRLANNRGIVIKRQKRQCDKHSDGAYYLLEANGQYGHMIATNFLQKEGGFKNLGPVEYIKKDHLIFTKTTQIHKREYSGTVYNIEVENDNSYVCNNFVVHNSYATQSDPRGQNLPWKYYGNLPEPNDPQGQNMYGNPRGTPEQQERYQYNQFGKWRFDAVLVDFKPDVVIDIRDWWMIFWENDSILRDKFHWIIMACVDSYPQQWKWLHTYGQADTLLAYSHFGKRVMEEQSRCEIAKKSNLQELDVAMVCQPGIDIETYKPIDKKQIKARFNINPDVRFVGTVMRNQKRKLFPRMIEGFRTFKDKNGWLEPDHKKKRIKDIDNIKLLLHTSIRDVGFDIPEAIRREGLESEVYFTYICRKCGTFGVSSFIGSPAQCPHCKENAFDTPNTQFGLPDEHFANIFGLLDVYIQMSIAEGDGMPVQNAKACGVPVIMSDYAALYEKARNGGGIPVKGDLETESETMQWRHWFDRDVFVEKLTKIFKKKGLIEKLGREGRKCIETYYNWDLTAKKWEYLLDKAEIKKRDDTWDTSEKPFIMPEEALAEKEGLTNEEFITECYRELLGREPDDEGKANWLDNIQRGQTRQDIESYFRSKTNAKNHAIEMVKGSNEGGAPSVGINPLEVMANQMNKDDKFRILYCMPQTAGDVLLSTAIVKALKEKHPEASIYFATEKRYFPILKGNPNITKLFEYNDALLNYRASEPFGPQRGFVDLCYCPFIVTQRIPHWIHGGLGDSIAVTYGHLCGLSLTDQEIRKKIRVEKEPIDVPWKPGVKYVTFHAQTTQGPKDYSHWDEVFDRIKDITVVQVGSKEEPLLDRPGVVDMRGQTTPQQLAYLIDGAELHIGLDSFPAHIASAVDTRSIIVYGGTYAKQGGIQNSRAIEPQTRSGCTTSCHLVECVQEKQRRPKCIDNVPPDMIVDAIRDELGNSHVNPPKPIKISAYCIIKNGNENKFPYVACIKEALKVADEFIMVDGGSTDGTLEDLQFLAKNEPKLKVLQHEWDMDDPMLMGNEKTWARQQCTGDYLIQLDADEMLVEPKPGQILDMIRVNRKVEIFDFPVINMYGDDDTIRIDDSIWKWRLSKNNPLTIHGVYGEARDFDPETMQVVFDKKKSDGCEYINRDTLTIMPHVSILPPPAAQLHMQVVGFHKEGKEIPQEMLDSYKNVMQQISELMPHVVHYSWADLEAKKARGAFWETTWHGKHDWTHNSRIDIEDRINNNKELTIQVEIAHPLKGGFDGTLK
jgi:ADP-heptose:LPS heptosyltransferase/glycosyltransferase involved in cell wall biosynthesis